MYSSSGPFTIHIDRPSHTLAYIYIYIYSSYNSSTTDTALLVLTSFFLFYTCLLLCCIFHFQGCGLSDAPLGGTSAVT